MSSASLLNGNLASSPSAPSWSRYAAFAHPVLKNTNISTAALLLFSAPLIIISLNILRQIIVPRRATDPPVIFHWLPFVGSAIAYGNDPLGFLFDCQEKYGNVFTFILLGRRVTVALGPKGNNFVFGGKSTVFSAEDAYKHLTTPVFGKGVIYDVPNEVFMEQKRFVKVGLSTDNLRAYVGMIEEEIENAFKNDATYNALHSTNTNGWGSFDVVKAMQEITILTAARTLQGKEVRGGMDKTFADLYRDLDDGFTPLNLMFPNLPLESYRRRDRAHVKMSKFYVNIINKRRSGNDNHEHDMIAALMQQRYRNGRLLNDREVAHLMITLLMAGQHTSSATASWALLHLAARPDIADALYKEQSQVFADRDGTLRPLTYEELRGLPLLDSVIRETLRVHPPIHSVMRYVRDDVPVPATLASPSKDGIYIVPRGNYVLASPAISQVDPTVWKSASEWHRYRWNDQEGVAAQAYKIYTDDNGEKIDYGFGAVSKGTESPYQPFGAGKHRCIGEQFAYLQLGTLISTFIRRMELKTDTVPANDYHTLVTMPKTPRSISYRRRG
ncbi:hypothetical protein D9619_004798 [Psilocybe cf. subviscida]|uniref:Lanosterol 14-alpha-demethylase n=1 Tax=Psilocybe cf. subviscida TaxID=2480587 RepID=A0A8H5BQF8_9AGAR|nr:hypothetical protein D9619_004798 [Psilocybe cf. subviscida]